MSSKTLPVACVDLFCGAGGLTHGLRKKGIQVTAGVDLDPACKFPYERNNGRARFYQRDIKDVGPSELLSWFAEGKLKLLAGCAPCQPFSTYRRGLDTSGDDKWGLLRSFGQLVQQVQPDLVTMENVPKLPSHAVFDEFLSAFEGYHTWWSVVNCNAYGIPQNRRRLVFLASKLGPIKLIPPTHTDDQVTVADVIKWLPALEAGARDPDDPLHAAAGMSELNLRRIKASKPGGTWQDWDSELVADCHGKSSGKTFSSVYGRMRWDQPAPTMTTQCYGFGNGRFGHPEQHRGISLREAALFQTFPENYQFLEEGNEAEFRTVGRLIGNAVPVRLGEVIGTSIRNHLKEHGRVK
ncbi:DNA cytosine methyltransferase [Stenotrophomonas maltophilia]|uniref:DNA cytosine methyltransferase n=1 Tax=Stenotrophomonas maltophilia TaxID=40324 RepID=UPI0013DA09C3|nr:DNA cytosine methyltransferase [Stenotrophomonas maltophilia]ELF4101220.1 DNA cytosine methyltransferase [Stenotrophomonas maltophilia]WQI21872.1 DNA cytosine methyltransferase [Stenotrophomonas maltophilia]